jgi:thiaminase/transcriptional activator TenA
MNDEITMTITFADEMKQYSIKKWQKILNYKFVIELSKDILPMNKFLFYLEQDNYFLQVFARFLQSAKQKTMDTRMKDWLDSLYISTVDFEMKMQRQLLDTIFSFSSNSDTTTQNISPSETTLEYTRYLLHISSSGTFNEIVSAMAPCPWTYLEIAQLLSKYHTENDVYRNWIQFYCSNESHKQVEELKQILNTLSENENEKSKERMKNHFASACKYEYLFWDMAYNLGKP